MFKRKKRQQRIEFNTIQIEEIASEIASDEGDYLETTMTMTNPFGINIDQQGSTDVNMQNNEMLIFNSDVCHAKGSTRITFELFKIFFKCDTYTHIPKCLKLLMSYKFLKKGK